MPRVLIPLSRLKTKIEEELVDIWEIEVRCVLKKDMKTYKGCKMFQILLMDDYRHPDINPNEIECLAFNENADRFYELFQQNGFYRISQGIIQKTKKEIYSKSKGCMVPICELTGSNHPYKLELNENSKVVRICPPKNFQNDFQNECQISA